MTSIGGRRLERVRDEGEGRVTTTSPASETVAHAQARWARTRLAGRRAFVWRYGVASWGLPAGALTTVYRILRVRASTPGMALSVAAVSTPLAEYRCALRRVRGRRISVGRVAVGLLRGTVRILRLPSTRHLQTGCILRY